MTVSLLWVSSFVRSFREKFTITHKRNTYKSSVLFIGHRPTSDAAALSVLSGPSLFTNIMFYKVGIEIS